MHSTCFATTFVLSCVWFTWFVFPPNPRVCTEKAHQFSWQSPKEANFSHNNNIRAVWGLNPQKEVSLRSFPHEATAHPTCMQIYLQNKAFSSLIEHARSCHHRNQPKYANKNGRPKGVEVTPHQDLWVVEIERSKRDCDVNGRL